MGAKGASPFSAGHKKSVTQLANAAAAAQAKAAAEKFKPDGVPVAAEQAGPSSAASAPPPEATTAALPDASASVARAVEKELKTAITPGWFGSMDASRLRVAIEAAHAATGVARPLVEQAEARLAQLEAKARGKGEGAASSAPEGPGGAVASLGEAWRRLGWIQRLWDKRDRYPAQDAAMEHPGVAAGDPGDEAPGEDQAGAGGGQPEEAWESAPVDLAAPIGEDRGMIAYAAHVLHRGERARTQASRAEATERASAQALELLSLEESRRQQRAADGTAAERAAAERQLDREAEEKEYERLGKFADLLQGYNWSGAARLAADEEEREEVAKEKARVEEMRRRAARSRASPDSHAALSRAAPSHPPHTAPPPSCPRLVGEGSFRAAHFLALLPKDVREVRAAAAAAAAKALGLRGYVLAEPDEGDVTARPTSEGASGGPTVHNTTRLRQIEDALALFHNGLGKLKPVSDWPDSTSLPRSPFAPTGAGAVGGAVGGGEELIEFTCAAHGLAPPPGYAAPNPVAVLLGSADPSRPAFSDVLGVSEWVESSSQPTFKSVFMLDPTALRRGPSASLQLELRHVGPEWDAYGALLPFRNGSALQPTAPIEQAALATAPLLGACRLSLAEAIGASCTGRALVVPLETPAPGGLGSSTLAGCAVLRLSSAQGWLTNHAAEASCAASFSFSPAGAGAPDDAVRVCEHLRPCVYAVCMPRMLLAAVQEEARIRAQLSKAGAQSRSARQGTSLPRRRNGAPPCTSGPAAIQTAIPTVSLPPKSRSPTTVRAAHWLPATSLPPTLERMLALLGPAEWEELARFCGKAIAQLATTSTAEQLSLTLSKTVGGSSLEALAPLPTNMRISLLEVRAQASGGIYPTVSLGAFDAGTVGASDGGVAAIRAKVERLEEEGGAESPSKLYGGVPATVSLACSYFKGWVLLRCQLLAALATVFAASCQARVAASDSLFFRSMGELGFLLHAEALLSTVGEEWAQLQDVAEAMSMIESTRLLALPPGSAPSGGVALQGDWLNPMLAFSLTELGFRSADHARSLGMQPGAPLGVQAALFSQGFDEKQTLANLLRANTAARAAANARALERLADFHADFAATVRVKGWDDAANSGIIERQRQALDRARQALRRSAAEKSVELLSAVVELGRLLGAGRLLMCRSGVELCAMAATHEYGALLQAHGLNEPAATSAVQVMRQRSPWRENVRLNSGGQNKLYRFSWLQYQMLPVQYRPPKGTTTNGLGFSISISIVGNGADIGADPRKQYV